MSVTLCLQQTSFLIRIETALEFNYYTVSLRCQIYFYEIHSNRSNDFVSFSAFMFIIPVLFYENIRFEFSPL